MPLWPAMDVLGEDGADLGSELTLTRRMSPLSSACVERLESLAACLRRWFRDMRAAHEARDLPAARWRATRSPARSAATRSSPSSGETVLDRLASGDRTPARGEAFPLADVTLLAPVPRPRAIFGIGLNYRAHAEEGGPRAARGADRLHEAADVRGAADRARCRCPAVVRRLDYEGELAVVMGAGGEVAGYAVADDVSARATCRSASRSGRARRAPTASARGARGSRPPTRSPDPEDLALRTWVNGELRQDARTSDLIFGDRATRRVPRGDVHARARRPHPHRHARRASARSQDPPRVPAPQATSCGSRSRGSARSSTPSREREVALVALDDLVDEAVLGGLVGLEEAVALHVLVDLLERLLGVLGVDLVDPLARLEDLLRVDLDVGRLALEARPTAGG